MGIMASREERVERIRSLDLFSDRFMTFIFRNKKAVEHVVRVILKDPEITVIDAHTQYTIPRTESREVRLDVLAEDSKGRIINIEIQRADNVVHAKRTRLYHSAIDSSFIAKGSEYSNLPDTYVIYISLTDIWKGGRAVYYVSKSLSNGTAYDDGQHTIYVNASVEEKDEPEITALMKYFRTCDPSDDSQGKLSDYVQNVKNEKEGQDSMLKFEDDEIYKVGKEEGRAQGFIENALAMLRKGRLTLEEIAEYSSLSVNDITELARVNGIALPGAASPGTAVT